MRTKIEGKMGSPTPSNSNYLSIEPQEGGDGEAKGSPSCQSASSVNGDPSVDVTTTNMTTGMTRKQKLIVAVFCLSNFGTGLFYSLLGPFFPNEVINSLIITHISDCTKSQYLYSIGDSGCYFSLCKCR